MRVIRDGKCVKIIPKKYELAARDFNFSRASLRLRPDERFLLLQKHIKHHFIDGLNSSNHQIRYASGRIQKSSKIDILKVDKRTHIQWRIIADGIEINVGCDMVSDCPEQYLKHKNEF